MQRGKGEKAGRNFDGAVGEWVGGNIRRVGRRMVRQVLRWRGEQVARFCGRLALPPTRVG